MPPMLTPHGLEPGARPKAFKSGAEHRISSNIDDFAPDFRAPGQTRFSAQKFQYVPIGVQEKHHERNTHNRPHKCMDPDSASDMGAESDCCHHSTCQHETGQ